LVRAVAPPQRTRATTSVTGASAPSPSP